MQYKWNYFGRSIIPSKIATAESVRHLIKSSNLLRVAIIGTTLSSVYGEEGRSAFLSPTKSEDYSSRSSFSECPF